MNNVCSQSTTFSTMILRAGNNIGLNSNFSYLSQPPSIPGADVETIETFDILSTAPIINSVTFSPQRDFTQFEIINSTIYTGIAIAQINEVDITCSTTSLEEGFTFDNDCLTINVEAGNNCDYLYDQNSFSWTFGDGSTSTDVSPSHTYISAGTYEVCVNVINDIGCCGQYCEDVTVFEDCMDCTECPTNSQTIILDGNDPDFDQLSEVIADGVFNSSTISGYTDIVVCGIFDFDVPANVNGCNFRFAPGAGIDITSIGSTSFSSSDFRGCTKMWRGIDINPNEVLGQTVRFGMINNFSDAETGLILNNNSDLSTFAVPFNDNYISIYSKSNNNITKNANTEINDCHFISSGTLLPQYQGQPNWSPKPYAGVYATDINTINIFGSATRFDGLRNGVLVENCNLLSVENSLFRNFSIITENNFQLLPSSSGYGIFVRNSIISRIKHNTFNQIPYGISGSRSFGILAEFNTFQNAPVHPVLLGNRKLHGIYLSTCHNGYIAIRDNTFNDMDEEKYVCIKTTNITPLEFNINDNKVNRGISDVIDLTNVNPISHAFVLDNIITDSKTFGAVVELDNCQKISVDGNIISAINEGPNYSYLISTKNTTNTHYRDNNISAMGHRGAFYTKLSPNNLFCCNILTNITTGFLFHGGNYPTSLTTNTMDKDMFTGLFLNEAEIGEQDNMGNIWKGNTTRATIYGTDIDDLAELSPFKVHYNQQDMLPTDIFPMTDWFNNSNIDADLCVDKPDCEVTPYFNNSNEGGGNNILSPCDSLMKHVDRIFNQPSQDKFANVRDWMRAYTFYITRFHSDSDLLRLDCDSIKQAIENNSLIDEYFAVERDIHNALKVNQSEQHILSNSNEIINQNMIDINNLLLLPRTTNIDDQIAILQEEINNHSLNIKNINTIIKTRAISEGIRLQSIIATLPEVYDFHSQMKKVWMTETKILEGGNSAITIQELNNIRAIAFDCPLSQGTVVYDARVILDNYEFNIYPDIDSQCIGRNTQQTPQYKDDKIIHNRNIKKLNSEEILCYPNPSNGNWTIDIKSSDMKLSQINIYNTLGEIVYTKHINAGTSSINIDLDNPVTGVYFIHIYNKTGNVYSTKMFIK